jgi:hypothetical protein
MRRRDGNGKVERVPAAIAMLARDEFANRPFGFSGGEVLVARDEPPAPPWPAPFTVPEWPDEERRREHPDVVVESAAAVSAVEQLMSDAAALGELDEPPPVGPPATLGPLTRPRFPEPDWNEEERQAIERNRRERLERAERLLAEHREPPEPFRPDPPPWSVDHLDDGDTG